MENENVDDVSTSANRMEDVKSHGIQTDNKSFTLVSHFHCVDSGSSDVDAKTNKMREHEDDVKTVLDFIFRSADLAVWERLAFSGPLIDPSIYYHVEENHPLTQRARMPTGLCKESDHERRVPTTFTTWCKEAAPQQGKLRVPTTFTTWCKEAAPQQGKLLFDCIEVALRLSLELAMRSYGFLVPCMQFPPTYFEEAVNRRLGEWKGLAFSMNLDDMMKVEINAGMGRWFKYGDEVESVTENVEAMIFNCLIDELMQDVLQKAQACYLCI